MTLRGRAKVEAVRLHGQFKLSTPSSSVILLCERCSFVAFAAQGNGLPVDLHFLPHASNAPSLVSRLTLRLSMSVDNRTSNQTSALK